MLEEEKGDQSDHGSNGTQGTNHRSKKPECRACLPLAEFAGPFQRLSKEVGTSIGRTALAEVFRQRRRLCGCCPEMKIETPKRHGSARLASKEKVLEMSLDVAHARFNTFHPVVVGIRRCCQ